MKDIDYSQWADYIEQIFRRNGVSPSLAADLGCGTGSFCMEMAKRGYEMIGIDLSAEMLSCARQKALEAGADILYLNQDMTEFELYGTVDAITCLMDSVNYVTYKSDLKRLFRLVNNYLNPGGLFVFDINSPYKIENILGTNVFCKQVRKPLTSGRTTSTKARGSADLTLLFSSGRASCTEGLMKFIMKGLTIARNSKPCSMPRDWN
jgi:2-polyprenyl-3-methyl-5-hydroxy-6-metoxy-1,4-benzoquinol methylase